MCCLAESFLSCKATSAVEAISRSGVGSQHDPSKVAGRVVENVTQQSPAPPAATMRRENVKTPQPSGGFVLAVDAAYPNQSSIDTHSIQSLSRLIESIPDADPIIAKADDKSESFMLTCDYERFHLNPIQAGDACDHRRLATNCKPGK